MQQRAPASCCNPMGTLWNGRCLPQSSLEALAMNAIVRVRAGFGMAENFEITEGMFPELDEAQIARLMPLGEERRVAAHEIIFDQGDSEHGVFVVLEGSIELVSVANGNESVLTTHGPGMF